MVESDEKCWRYKCVYGEDEVNFEWGDWHFEQKCEWVERRKWGLRGWLWGRSKGVWSNGEVDCVVVEGIGWFEVVKCSGELQLWLISESCA